MASAVRLWGPAALWAGTIFVASSRPVPAAVDASAPDWLLHTAVYLVLAVLIGRARAGGFGRPVSCGVALWAFAAATVYGATDELHQRFVPGRSPELADLLADGAGALLGALGLKAITGLFEARAEG